MTTRERVATALVALLALAGFLLITLAGGHLGLEVAGMIVLGLAGIALVSGAFYLVGRSEDRDRG